MVQIWKGAVLIRFIAVAGGVFFWSFISSCANCYDKQLNILLQPGVELHLGLCDSAVY